MNSPSKVRKSIVAVVIGVLIGGGLMAVTPAGAEVAQMAATNWKKIWKQELQPQADKRYYKKKNADKKFAAKKDTYTKAETYAKTETYNKTETDAKYQLKGSYATAGSSYTKAESDAKYAPFPSLIRGAYAMEDSAGPTQLDSAISFGTTLSAAPTTHFIASGAALPVGCSGTAAAPNAAPGHLCIFEQLFNNVASRNVFQTTAFGAVAYISPTTAGSPVWSIGTWAVRPVTLGALPARATSNGTGATNGTASEAAGKASSSEH